MHALLQMIDLYWMVIPILLLHYFATHPLAEYNGSRSRLLIFLTSAWSLRLSHCYLRREKWQLGDREDWRFNDMRRRHGRNWWWISLFAVYISQQVIIKYIKVLIYPSPNPSQNQIFCYKIPRLEAPI